MSIKKLYDIFQTKYGLTNNNQFQENLIQLNIYLTNRMREYLENEKIDLSFLEDDYFIDIQDNEKGKGEDYIVLPAEFWGKTLSDVELKTQIENWVEIDIYARDFAIIFHSKKYNIRCGKNLDSDEFGLFSMTGVKIRKKNSIRSFFHIKFFESRDQTETPNTVKKIITSHFYQIYKQSYVADLEYPDYLLRKLRPFEDYLIQERKALQKDEYKPKVRYYEMKWERSKQTNEQIDEDAGKDPEGSDEAAIFYFDDIPPKAITEAGNYVTINEIESKKDGEKTSKKFDKRTKIHLIIENWDENNNCLIFEKPRNLKNLENVPPEGVIQLESNLTNNARKQKAIKLLKNPISSPLFTLTDLLLRPEVFSPIQVENVIPINSDIEQNNVQTKTQYGALQIALCSPDIAIIQGPPGSGKTTTICEVIQQVTRSGGRVLACAPTHVAIDNILDRLDKSDANYIQMVRIGRSIKIKKKLKKYLIENVKKNWMHFVQFNIEKRDVDPQQEIQEKKRKRKIYEPKSLSNHNLTDLRKHFLDNLDASPQIVEDMILNSSNLVCGTSTGVVTIYQEGRAIQDFDLMIIDESSKATILEFLIPATHAKKWLIVGDQNQLPPYVEDREVKIFFQYYFKQFYEEDLARWNKTAEIEFKKRGRSQDADYRTARDVKVDPFIELLMAEFKRDYEDFHFLKDVDSRNEWYQLYRMLDYRRDLISKFSEFISILGSCYHYFFSRLQTYEGGRSRLKFLDYQYRMPLLVANFISKNVYNGNLKSAKNVQTHGISIPANTLIRNNAPFKDMAFFSTSNLSIHKETPGGRTSRKNEAETIVIKRIIADFYMYITGLSDVNEIWKYPISEENEDQRIKKDNPFTIGIINFYASQAFSISNALKTLPFLIKIDRSTWAFKKYTHCEKYSKSGCPLMGKCKTCEKYPIEIRVSIVDRFQGQEQDIIIIPMTRSNDFLNIGFLRSKQRANVAFSRVKHFLNIVGDANFFSKLKAGPYTDIYINLVEYCRQNKILYAISDADVPEISKIKTEGKKQFKKDYSTKRKS